MSNCFKSTRIVQLTDWLPPEFSAVSQYALLIAEEEAVAGRDVTVIGLSNTGPGRDERRVGSGKVTIIKLKRERYRKESWVGRLAWSLITNLILIVRGWPELRRADTIRFTGSPPFLLLFVVTANLLLRRKLVYRITDFYPECIIAAVPRGHAGLELLRHLTNRFRRRVDHYEVIGNDMRRRLVACGIAPDRIVLRRDSSPVSIAEHTEPLPVPPELQGKKILLYSGNWGVAHDIETFFEGYRQHQANGTGSVMLWLNATGSGADQLERRLTSAGLPFYRQRLVPLTELPRLLITPDAHLITLKDAFSGYVLPSKIYGCLASRKPILYIGPTTSDVHELCTGAGDPAYRRVGIGDSEGVFEALEFIGLPRQALKGSNV